MILLTLLIIIPLIEIAIFYAVGTQIGIVQTIALYVLTAILGGFFVQQQGFETLIKGQRALNEGFLPLEELFDGVCIVVAGLLLLAPGFLSDGVALALLFPFVRRTLRGAIARHFEMREPEGKDSSVYQEIIEGSFVRIDEDGRGNP